MFIVKFVSKPLNFFKNAINLNPSDSSLVTENEIDLDLDGNDEGEEIVGKRNIVCKSRITKEGSHFEVNSSPARQNFADTEAENELSANNDDCASSSASRVQNKRGRITLLDSCMPIGVIDNTYEFIKSTFCEELNLNLKRGQEVIFSAIYEADSAKWLVTDLRPCLTEEQLVVNERAKYRTLVYKVKEIRGPENGNDVIVGPGQKNGRKNNGNFNYDSDYTDYSATLNICQDLLPKDYPVRIGDWLTIKLEAAVHDDSPVHEDVSSAKLISVDWTDQMVTVGHVKKHSYQLCIDGIIAYTPDVVHSNGRLLSFNDKVKVISVASDQDGFPKRALSVTLIKSGKRASDQSAADDYDWEDEDPSTSLTKDREFDALFETKNGIRITPNRFISFGHVKMGQTTEIVVRIFNDLKVPAVLRRVHIGTFQDVCKFQLLFESSSTSSSESNTIVNNNSPTITLLPSATFELKISCCPVQLGRTKELCIFNFGDFEIGRWLTVNAIPNDDLNTSLEVKRNGVQNANNSKSLASTLESLAEQREMSLVRGPTAVRMAFFIANKIPSSPVPRDFHNILRHEDTHKLNSLYPGTNWEILEPKNYSTRFHVALWFEEIENEVARRHFDMHGVVMEPYGNNELTFRAPGLKEITPPVLQGDPIKCFYPNDPRQYMYTGHVTKLVFPDDSFPQCFVKFSEEFYRSYSNSKEGLTVQFVLGRTPFRRAHFAVNQALEYLGFDWLFPQSISMKPPRIPFVEDEQDNVEPPVTNKILIGNRNTTSSSSSVSITSPENGNENLFESTSRGRPTDVRSKNIFAFKSMVKIPKIISNAKLRWFNPHLNEEQRNAVRRILRGQGRPLPYIIFGPPGTGKTVTVVEAILQIYFMETTSRILVTVPSNAGADLIAEYLIATNRFVPGDLVRLNGFIRSSVSLTDSIADFCVDGENLESVAKHRLIITTVTTAGQFFQLNLNTGHFSHVFVDEAGYCTEPEALIAAVLTAVNKEGQLILAGDPKQLGPVLMCDLLINEVLEKSLLERLMESPIYQRDEEAYPTTKYNSAVLTKLIKCYRCHEILLKLPSQKFYSDELVSLASYEDSYRLCEELDFLPKKGIPLILHGIQGLCSKEPGANSSQSWYNLSEVSQIVHYVRKLRNNGVANGDIGIITPYRKQVEKIKKALQLFLLENEIPKVASVQEFQGGERKVMIISTVRTERNDDIIRTKMKEHRFEFLCSEKRFNVAVTRAKGLMIIVGDPHLLYHLPWWTDYLKYAVELGVYVGCDKPRQLESKRLRDFLNHLPSDENSFVEDLSRNLDKELSVTT